MRKTITIIRTEHRRFSAVINCFVGILGDLETGKLEPDFDLLKLIHRYFREFLFTFHHPKEDKYLFPALLKAKPELSEAIAKLESEHETGLNYLAHLDSMLQKFEAEPKDALFDYVSAARAYRDFEWQHMGLEERDILGVADKDLPEEVWAELDRVFSDHADPLFGDEPAEEFAGLLSQIVNAAPAPHGLA